MFKQLFRRKTDSRQSRQDEGDGWLSPTTGAELLSQPYRQQIVKALWDLTSLTKPVFGEFVQKPLERYAELVQLLPASESHHHAYAGGMLDHTLEAVSYALRIRQRHMLPPGATPEEQSSSSERWTVAIAYGALLHDAAKILVDLDICLRDGRMWRVWHGPIPGQYRVRYRKGRDYMLHQAINGLLCQRILDAKILDWLHQDAQVFGQLMFTMSGHGTESGIIGDIVSQADRASVASNLGGDPAKALQAPVESLQRKLLDALRYLVKQQLSLNVPRAPAYLTEDALWIVAPSVPNQLKGYLLEHGVGGVPSNTTRMYDEMQSHGLIEEASEGKAVWKADVQIDDWKASLSFLKVPPSLVWGAGEERPAALNGTLNVLSGKNDKNANTGNGEDKAAGKTSNPPIATKQATTAHQDPQAQVESETVEAVRSDTQAEGALDFDSMVALISGEGADNPPPSPEPAERSSPILEPPDLEETEEAQGRVKVNEKPGSGAIPLGTELVEPGSGSDDLGVRFVAWLDDALKTNKLIVNDSKALVHVVDQTYFLVSPGIFKRFCHLSFGSDKAWNKVQQRFQKQHLHIKTHDGMNIWEASVRGPNRRGNVLKGYRLRPEGSFIPGKSDNVFLSLLSTDTEAEDA